jgi:hypothetical protein
MKKQVFSGLLIVLVILSVNFMSCGNPSNPLDPPGVDPHLTDLQKYQNAGANVAAKEYTEDYDCSNFSTQFYQNCYNLGLPCRVRLGKYDISSAEADHAWNSVKINGTWVNWEPQLNGVCYDHIQTRTPMGAAWGVFVKEDIARIIYENIGKHVPSSIIDAYEIDAHWNNNSPYYEYFLFLSYCLSDDPDPDIQSFVSELQDVIPNNNSGDIFIFNQQYLAFFFKYGNKYYGIEYLEKNDPFEGRNVIKGNNLGQAIVSGTEFTKSGLNFSY